MKEIPWVRDFVQIRDQTTVSDPLACDLIKYLILILIRCER